MLIKPSCRARGGFLIANKRIAMKPKKNIDKDLNHKRGLYFILALLLILTIIYFILEWKTDADNKGYDLGVFQNKELTKEDSTFILETRAVKKQKTLDQLAKGFL